MKSSRSSPSLSSLGISLRISSGRFPASYRQLAVAVVMLALGTTASAQEAVRDSLAVQEARNLRVANRGKNPWYTKTFDLSGLPHYRPESPVTGKLRIWGNNYIADGKLSEYWKVGFTKFHPKVEFEYYLPTSAIGLPAVTCGVADLGMTRKATFLELLSFQRLHKRDPLELPAVRGAYNVPGWSPSFAIFVNAANPVKGLSMKQLDGIFGGQRLGGWEGTEWHPEYARPADQNIRKWGQVGLTGEWADKAITPYAVSMRYNSTDNFSDLVLKGSNQYTENLLCHANYRIPGRVENYGWWEQIRDKLDVDLYGIAYSFANALTPKSKILPIQAKDGGPFIPLTLETTQDLSYPLGGYVYFYANRDPKQPTDPKVKEFMRYVLSQEGQNEVQRDGKYLPLTAEVVAQTLKLLD